MQHLMHLLHTVAQEAVHSAVERAEEEEQTPQEPAAEPPAEEAPEEAPAAELDLAPAADVPLPTVMATGEAPAAELDLAPAADVPLPTVMATGENGPVPTPDDEGASTDLGCSTSLRRPRLQVVWAQDCSLGSEKTTLACETVWRIVSPAMDVPWHSLVPKLSFQGSSLDKILSCLPQSFCLLLLRSGVAS